MDTNQDSLTRQFLCRAAYGERILCTSASTAGTADTADTDGAGGCVGSARRASFRQQLAVGYLWQPPRRNLSAGGWAPLSEAAGWVASFTSGAVVQLVLVVRQAASVAGPPGAPRRRERCRHPEHPRLQRRRGLIGRDLRGPHRSRGGVSGGAARPLGSPAAASGGLSQGAHTDVGLRGTSDLLRKAVPIYGVPAGLQGRREVLAVPLLR